jgi:DNA-binding protein Fis
MRRYKNNITRTAKALGLTRQGFKKRLVKLGLREQVSPLISSGSR